VRRDDQDTEKENSPKKQPADGNGAALDAKRAEAYFDMEPHLCDCVKMGRIAAQLFDDPDSELYDLRSIVLQKCWRISGSATTRWTSHLHRPAIQLSGPPRFGPGGPAEHCSQVDRTARRSLVIKTGFDGWGSRQSALQPPTRPLLPRTDGFFWHARSRPFRQDSPMNYQAFTNDSLTMMYEGIRGALESDDELVSLGEQPRFRVRETPDWKMHAADLESEMLKRGMTFDPIDWSEG
jgi:hypothetical protein